VRVSVVIPVRDGAAFIAEALDSVRNQTRPADEIVVVDDGSSDDSAAVAETFPGVRVLRQPPTGAAAARNAGVAATHGELIAFLDADDVWTPDKLARQVEHLATYPELGGVLGLQKLILSPGVELPQWAVRSDGTFNEGAESMAPPSTLVLRRAAWDLVGPMDSEMQVGEDTDWLLRAAELGVRLESLGDVVLLRRIHGANLTYDHAAMRRSIALALKRRIDRRRAREQP
jgi:glycosyltransferase involved in cell wall biosynthesis